ncbi:MAG: 50S ribosomal protein L15 [Candidatus Marinimicrobia bacterium]|nr:50S ribosomal protein L15 [Candidatus Neomarinimicrobiota bacterium]|tara:strand:+ start:2909 stop:3349 length:441 start_codon:yes stop_codon:yes gene_type:complete
MKLNKLLSPRSFNKSRKRIGRGQGSGKGKTSGRGNKGYHSRSGSKRRSWFEGGQMPLQRRVPKRGFSNLRFKIVYQIVSLSSISNLGLEKVDITILLDNGLIQSGIKPVKILANGEINNAVEVFANAFSEGAINKIEKAGGKAVIL